MEFKNFDRIKELVNKKRTNTKNGFFTLYLKIGLDTIKMLEKSVPFVVDDIYQRYEMPQANIINLDMNGFDNDFEFLCDKIIAHKTQHYITLTQGRTTSYINLEYLDYTKYPKELINDLGKRYRRYDFSLYGQIKADVGNEPPMEKVYTPAYLNYAKATKKSNGITIVDASLPYIPSEDSFTTSSYKQKIEILQQEYNNNFKQIIFPDTDTDTVTEKKNIIEK